MSNRQILFLSFCSVSSLLSATSRSCLDPPDYFWEMDKIGCSRLLFRHNRVQVDHGHRSLTYEAKNHSKHGAHVWVTCPRPMQSMSIGVLNIRARLYPEQHRENLPGIPGSSSLSYHTPDLVLTYTRFCLRSTRFCPSFGRRTCPSGSGL